MNTDKADDKEIEQAREDMLEGKETPWLDRETHRGQEAYTKSTEYVDPVEGLGRGGMHGGGNFGTSGSHQGSVSAGGHGGASSGGSHSNHGDDIEGAFGEEQGGPESFRHGDDTTDKATRELLGG